MLTFASCEKEKQETQKETDGKKWILSQDETCDQFEKVVESTEEVYSLYISGKMSSDDFLIELEILQAKLFSIEKDYKDEKDKTVIDPQSSDVAFEGIEHFENLFTEMNDLYLASVNSQGNPYSVIEMSYIYMNYQEKILDEYSKYTAAIYVLKNYSDSGEWIGTEIKSTESEVSAGE